MVDVDIQDIISPKIIFKIETYQRALNFKVYLYTINHSQLNLAWKRRHAPAGKRVLIVSCGVALASICSPVIAAVSVSVGKSPCFVTVILVLPQRLDCFQAE